MTEEELIQTLITCNVGEMASAVTGMSEEERKALYVHFNHFEKKGFRKGHIPDHYEWVMYPAKYLTQDYLWIVPQFEKATPVVLHKVGLLRLALGTLADAKRVEMDNNEEFWAALVKVLDDRRPPWADQWLAHWLGRERWWSFVCWPPVYALMERGVCGKPTLDNYYHLLARGVTTNYWKGGLSGPKSPGTYRTSDYLRDHPDLLKDMYGVLRVDSYALVSPDDPWAESDYSDDEPLAHALRALSEEGLLDRERLLRASLDGLAGGHVANVLSRLANFYEGMNPSKAEVVASQAQLISLLSAQSDRVVAFAIKMLKKVEQAKALDDGAFVDGAIPLLGRKGKGLVKSVLAQLQKIGKRSPAQLPTILEAVGEQGLAHPDTDVQEACLKLLEVWKDSLGERARSALDVHVEDVATTLQDRVRALAGTGPSVAPREPKATVAKKAKAPEKPELPAAWCASAGVDSARAALETDTMPPPLLIDSGTVPVLTGLKAVCPPETLDDIILLAGRQIDETISAMEMEQLLGAISETDPAAEENFDRLAAPLLKRMDWAAGELGHLLYTWLSRGKVHERFEEELPTAGIRGTTFWQYQNQRIRAVRARILKGTYLPLLATPTHEGGWLMASALVDRLCALTEQDATPGTLDLVQSLLRLAPDGRESAASKLAGGKTQLLRVVRWALTGEGGFKKGDDPDLWLAAARGRHPHQVFDVPGLKGDQFFGPDGAGPAIYDWIDRDEKVAMANAEKEAREEADKALEKALEKLDESSERGLDLVLASVDQFEAAVPGGGWLHRPLREEFSLKVTPLWVHGGDRLSRPSVLLHAFPSGGAVIRREAFELEWGALTWPHNRDTLFASALLFIAHAYGNSSSKKWPECECLTPLFEPDQPITLPAAMAIGLALFAPSGDLSRTAIDVLVEAIADGRAHPDQFTEPMLRVCTMKWFQPARMAACLGEVAQVSPLHTWAVAGMLQPIVGSWREIPKNGHHILTLLLESLAQLGDALDSPAADALGQIKCSGKSAKLAKQLLDLKGVDNGTMAAARELALEVRLARAARWAQSIL